MPWRECSAMEERLRFVARLLDGEGMSDVCRGFGISRKTGYKIFNRYKDDGLEALTDRSRRPVRYANQLPDQIERTIVRLKKDKPHWGARKIRELLIRQLAGDVRMPAKSTVHAVLDRHGLVSRARQRRRCKAEGTLLSQAAVPNDLWCADFKVDVRELDTRVISHDRMTSPDGLFLPTTASRGLALLGPPRPGPLTKPDRSEEYILLDAVLYQPEAARREREAMARLATPAARRSMLRVIPGAFGASSARTQGCLRLQTISTIPDLQQPRTAGYNQTIRLLCRITDQALAVAIELSISGRCLPICPMPNPDTATTPASAPAPMRQYRRQCRLQPAVYDAAAAGVHGDDGPALLRGQSSPMMPGSSMLSGIVQLIENSAADRNAGHRRCRVQDADL